MRWATWHNNKASWPLRPIPPERSPATAPTAALPSAPPTVPSPPTARGLLRLSLANKVLTNVAGDDLIVSESGGASAPEAYMVRVSTNGTTFSSWQFRQAQIQYGNAEYLTGFDFVNDFGLAPTATVRAVEIQNCIISDRVNSSTGEGAIVFSGDAGYNSASTLTAGSLNADGNVAFRTSRFDADPLLCLLWWSRCRT